jgi:NAD(P)-dependent dehydrogenase (short-subunit alcohol dehydrogenase family)
MAIKDETGGTLLLVGASRGLGYAMAAEFLERGWKVVGTVRGAGPTPLHDLAEAHRGRLEIETLDICAQDQITALSHRLAGRKFDILFVNAGTADEDPRQTISEVTTDEFVRVMVTNALSPMRVIEGLLDQITSGGLIGAMSSGQGSIANNATGMRELYRGSKAALNMFMRSLAARQAGRPMVLVAPGWIRTALGGSQAPFSVEEAIPAVVDVILAKRDRPGLEYLDRFGQAVPW